MLAAVLGASPELPLPEPTEQEDGPAPAASTETANAPADEPPPAPPTSPPPKPAAPPAAAAPPPPAPVDAAPFAATRHRRAELPPLPDPEPSIVPSDAAREAWSTMTAEELLAEAAALASAGSLGLARQAYAQVLLRFPETAAANTAQAALIELAKAQSAQQPPASSTSDPSAAVDSEQGPVRYSPETQEEVEIALWEKIDFVATASAYGMADAWVYLTQLQTDRGAGIPVMGTLGLMIFGGASLLYLRFGAPTRGDLPLALTILAYVPITSLLAGVATGEDGPTLAWIYGITGSAALVPAFLLPLWLDLDPGDTQLVRDSAFWLSVMACDVTTALFFLLNRFGPYINRDDDRVIGGATVAGLGVGLVAGAFGAALSELSLERVRVITLGGYAGTLLGAGLAIPVGMAAKNGGAALLTVAAGAALGLVTTFALTPALDAVPITAELVSFDRSVTFFSPTVFAARDRTGQPTMAFGLNLVQGEL